MKRLNDLKKDTQDDLFYYLMRVMSYHSNAIEGVSLSFKEVSRLINREITAANKSLTDHLIILGFKEALELSIKSACNNTSPMTIKLSHRFHQLLFYNAVRVLPGDVPFQIGQYRNHQSYITNSDVILASFVDIPVKMDILFNQYDVNNMSLDDIAQFHIAFEEIHPYSDGNGRVGRLLMNYQLLRNGYLPTLIRYEQRFDYYDSLEYPEKLQNIMIDNMGDDQTYFKIYSECGEI